MVFPIDTMPRGTRQIVLVDGEALPDSRAERQGLEARGGIPCLKECPQVSNAEGFAGRLGHSPNLPMTERKLDFTISEGTRAAQAVVLLKEHFGELTPERLRMILTGKDAKQGYVAIVEGDTVLAVAVYETAIADDGNKPILLRAMQGTTDTIHAAWGDHLEEFITWAKTQGCTSLTIQGRPFWARLLRKGWTMDSVIVSRPLLP